MPSVSIGANVRSVIRRSVDSTGKYTTTPYNAGPNTVYCYVSNSWSARPVGSSISQTGNSTYTYRIARTSTGGGNQFSAPILKLRNHRVVYSQRLTSAGRVA